MPRPSLIEGRMAVAEAAYRGLEAELGRRPTNGEVADRLGWSDSHAAKAMAALRLAGRVPPTPRGAAAIRRDADGRPLRSPRAAAQARRERALEAARRLHARLGRPPTASELAAELGCRAGEAGRDLGDLRRAGLLPPPAPDQVGDHQRFRVGGPRSSRRRRPAGATVDRPGSYAARALRSRRWTAEDQAVVDAWRRRMPPWFRSLLIQAPAALLPGAVESPAEGDDAA